MFTRSKAKLFFSLLVLFSLLLIPAPASAWSNGVALTPPMGWNSWNKFGCNINDALIRATVDAMVSSGMQAAGYQYINIDDCWSGSYPAKVGGYWYVGYSSSVAWGHFEAK